MLFDLALALWILLTIAMFVFLVLGIVFRKNESSRNKHFIRTGSFFIAGLVCFFVLFFSSTDVDSTSDQIAADGAEAVEEETEEPTEETTTEAEKEAAEKKAEEEKAAKEAAEREKEESIEAEKEKEESIEEEKSLEAEKVKEESIEEAKKEEEASIEEAKKEEESIEAEKAKEEKSIEEEKAAEKEEAKENSVASKEGLIPVNLYRVTDGDTVNVLDNNGEALKLRLLLIDTPETVHPNKPVEPYGKEASARLTELLNNADQLYIEYDSGAKTDHYDRQLVYLYADDVNVHEVLLKEGLARVGYIYEQQKYLSDFREAEQHAKDNQLGIWSIPGYVNEGGEGFNSEEPEPEPEPTNEPAQSQPAQSEPATTEQPAQPEFFQNCTDLRGTYPAGVPKGHAAYQSKMDRDKDDYACEVS